MRRKLLCAATFCAIMASSQDANIFTNEPSKLSLLGTPEHLVNGFAILLKTNPSEPLSIITRQ